MNFENAEFDFNAIGIVRNGYREKFTVPRQPGLVPSMESVIEIYKPYARPEAFRELEQFSHIWIIFVFHRSLGREWQPTVRPPRLGGNARVGVFASRSPFRPNPIGLSAVELLEIRNTGDRFELRVRGADLIDGTPVLDIKPYIPYADALDASGGYADRPPTTLQVEFKAAAARQLEAAEQRLGKPLRAIIKELLELDPRPAYHEQQRDQEQCTYGVRLFDFDLQFTVEGNRVTVTGLEETGTAPEPYE